MEGKDTKRYPCGCDDVKTEEHCHQRNYYHHSGDVTYKPLIFGCLFSTLCCLYLLNNAFTTRHQVDSLQTTVDKLETQLKDVLAARTDGHATNGRTKRAIPPAVRNRLPEPLISRFETRIPSHLARRQTTTWRRPTLPTDRTTTTSRPRVVPTVATFDRQRSRYLPVEAARTPNLVTSPDSSPPRGAPSGYRGTPGAPGRDGFEGTSITPGAFNTFGQNGAAGTPGEPGTDGTPVEDGAPGSPGFDGAPGRDGAPGFDGAPGRDGSPGFDGAPGRDGTPGFDGAPGSSGRNEVQAMGRPSASQFPNRSGFRGASTGSGATFTRWGKVTCPQTSNLVYSGYAAANHPWYGMGGSSELQCLSTYPSWQTNSPTQVQTTTKLFAAKFFLGSHTGVFNQTADNSVITCAVCFTTKAPVITMPGRVSCPYGWHNEYSGYLMSSTAVRYEMYFSSKNYCVDKKPDYYEGHRDTYGLKLTFLQAGSCYQNKAPCTQYVENNRMGCVVCSKVASSY